ncbi:MAG: HAD family hydrolase [Promethearchaeota archaeon]
MPSEIQLSSRDELKFLKILRTHFEAERFKKLNQLIKCSSLFFVADLNDSLLETRPKETKKQWELLDQYAFLVNSIASHISQQRNTPIYFAIVTGNSYEYVRGRLLEPFDLSNHIVFSEEGLVARAFYSGWGYTSKPSSQYYAAGKRLTKKLHKDLQTKGKFWMQPNEIRLTIKPIMDPRNNPAWHDVLVPRILAFGEEVGFSNTVSSNVVGSIHLQFDACDIHPNKVTVKHRDGKEETEVFVDKGYALRYLLKSEKGPGGVVLVDSINDIPLIREAAKSKLVSVAVANADDALIREIPQNQLYKSKHSTTAAAIGTLSEFCLALFQKDYQQRCIDSFD